MAESEGGEGREALLTMTMADSASAPLRVHLSPDILIQFPRLAVFHVAIPTFSPRSCLPESLLSG